MEFVYRLIEAMGYSHPLHPPMTYIPLGMIMGALIFRLYALFKKQPKYAVTARHCVTLAFIGIFPTIISGYLDWQYYWRGVWLHEINMKIILAISLTVLLLTIVLLHLKLKLRALLLFILYIFAFFNIAALGYYGGELVFGAGMTAQAETKARQPDDQVRFSEVQTIFKNNCVMCHSGTNAPKSLRLDSYEELMEGSDSGEIVIPGDPDQSELVKSLKGISEPRMPLGYPPLTEQNIRKIEVWIEDGAENR